MKSITLIAVFLVAMTLGFVPRAFAQEEVAEIVWVSVEQQQKQILFSRYAAGAWSQPATEIYRSDSSILTPFLLTLRDGSKMLLWSESRADSRMVVMLMRGQLDASGSISWSAAGELFGERKYNVGAVAALDGADNLWVFWVGEDDQDSDILQSSFNGTSWSAPKIAHAENDVPDLHPMVAIDADGGIELSWSSLSYSSYEYVKASKRLVPKVSERERKTIATELAAHKDVSTLQIPAPDFLPTQTQLIRMHFPGNRKQPFTSLAE